MPRNTSQSVTKKHSDETREPDDLKEGERTAQVGRRDRSGEYEDIEESRSTMRRDGDDADEVDDDDVLDEVDLDALAEGDGPDA